MPSSSRQPPAPDRLSQVWQARTDLVKRERDAASAAADAKTARLKALRLEKEAQDAMLRPAAVAKRGKRGI